MNPIYELVYRMAKFLVQDGKQSDTRALARKINTVSDNSYYHGGAGIAKAAREACKATRTQYGQAEADTIRQAFTKKNGQPLVP